MADSEKYSSVADLAEKSSGLPQLDASTYPSQIFWLVISFAILYFFMSKVSLPKIAETIHQRKTRIAGDLKQAEILTKEANETKSDFNFLVKDANIKSNALINKALEEAKLEEEVQLRKIEDKFEQQLLESESRVAIAKEKFDEEIVPVLTSLVASATKKLINVDADLDKVERLVQKNSKDFKNEEV